jgi:hypothetical protein
MAKAMSITVAAADAMLTAFGALCNGGTVRIYNNAIPGPVSTALSGNTILAEATLPNPAFTTFDTVSTSRRYAAGTITGDTQANASGTATFFRVFASAGNGGAAVWQGTVGTTDSDMIMVETDIIANGPVNISSMTVSLPMS